MASVLGLLEAREKKVREEVAGLREEAERVQAALGEAQRALQRLADARGTAQFVAEVRAAMPAGQQNPDPNQIDSAAQQALNITGGWLLVHPFVCRTAATFSG